MLKTRMPLPFVITRSSPLQERGRGLRLRGVKRKRDAHFGSRTGPAPDTKERADGFGPLPHSGQTAVRVPLKRGAINSAAVVADQQAQFAQILNFDFDRGRRGMT